jgi:hypothetical protein
MEARGAFLLNDLSTFDVDEVAYVTFNLPTGERVLVGIHYAKFRDTRDSPSQAVSLTYESNGNRIEFTLSSLSTHHRS